MMVAFNWISQPNESNQLSKTGTGIIHINVKTCATPFGIIWVGGTTLLSAAKVIIAPTLYTVLFNNLTVQNDIPDATTAIKIAEEWYNKTALQVHAQVSAQLAIPQDAEPVAAEVDAATAL